MLRSKIRKQYLLLFLFMSGLLGLGSLFALYENHSLYANSQKEELIREAYISNAILEAVLGDASKLLDVAQPKIERALNNGSLTNESAYQILKESHEAFSEFNTTSVFQLTVYIDENGIVRATSSGVESKHISLVDRLYFKSLKNNPKQTYAVGNLVTARTTGLLTFHIAVPVIDREGRFRGVITQQVAADELASHLAKSLKTLAEAQVSFGLDGGNIAFMYPVPDQEKSLDFHLSLYIDECVNRNGGPAGVIDISPTKEYPMHSYVGYAKSIKYGLVTTVSLPVEKVMVGFLRGSLTLLVFIALSFLSLSMIIWRFYKNGLEISKTLMMSYTDTMTGLKNRRAFDTEFPKFWGNALRSKESISTLFIDIDHFKNFNDQFGHDCGDIALIAVAQAIYRCVSRPLDFCCRWGGEEFVVLLPHTSESGAIRIANKILDEVRGIRLDLPGHQQPKVTVSIGIASMVVTNANKTDDLVDMSDKAMYLAKQSGRDQYAVYNKPE